MTAVNLFIICIITLILKNSYAAIVLVPHELSTAVDYHERCQKYKYNCFPQAFTQLVEMQSTSFQILMDEFDLDNKEYQKSFLIKLKKILSTEMLSFDELKMSIYALEKIQIMRSDRQNLKSFHKLLADLKKLIFILDKIDKANDQNNFILMFGLKLKLDDKSLNLLSPYLKDFKNYQVSHNQFIDTQKKKEYFMTGQCDQNQYAPLLQNQEKSHLQLQLLPYFSSGCGLTQSFTQSYDQVESHFEKNKNVYFWGLGLSLAAIVLSQYQVIIEH